MQNNILFDILQIVVCLILGLVSLGIAIAIPAGIVALILKHILVS